MVSVYAILVGTLFTHQIVWFRLTDSTRFYGSLIIQVTSNVYFCPTSEFVNGHTFIPDSFNLLISLKARRFSSTIISSKNKFAGKCLCVCDSLFNHNKYLNGT